MTVAQMLRKRASHAYGCCSHCGRTKSTPLKSHRRERRMARAIEKAALRRELRSV